LSARPMHRATDLGPRPRLGYTIQRLAMEAARRACWKRRGGEPAGSGEVGGWVGCGWVHVIYNFFRSYPFLVGAGLAKRFKCFSPYQSRCSNCCVFCRCPTNSNVLVCRIIIYIYVYVLYCIIYMCFQEEITFRGRQRPDRRP